jgi:hypothetical protein
MALSLVGPTSSAQHFRLPELLQDIRLLDLLELSGSTVQASQLLNLSQPTVSRRYRSLADDFGLLRDPRSAMHCRYGTSTAMRYLRLGSRAHRLGAGVARIGTDLMHHHLLNRCQGLLSVPLQYRRIDAWVELVHQGVLDAALISALELQAAPHADTGRLRLESLGVMPLALASSGSALRTVLVPHRGVSPGLHRALLNRDLKLKPISNQSLPAQQWLQRLSIDGTALAVDPACCAPGGWAEGLNVMTLRRELSSSVVLLLPRCDNLPLVLARVIDQVRCQLAAPEPQTS